MTASMNLFLLYFIYFFNPWRSERYTDSGGLAGECPPRRLEGGSGPFHYSSWLVLLYFLTLGWAASFCFFASLAKLLSDDVQLNVAVLWST